MVFHCKEHFDEETQYKISQYLEPKDPSNRPERPKELIQESEVDMENLEERFYEVIQLPPVFALFEKFLSRLFIVDNLRLYRDIYNFKSSPKRGGIKNEALEILKNYFGYKNEKKFAVECVDENHNGLLTIIETVEVDNTGNTLTRKLFDPIEWEVTSFLSDHWREFCESFKHKNTIRSTNVSVLDTGDTLNNSDHQFYNLLSNEELYREFLEYLRENFAQELLEFWKEVNNFMVDPIYEVAEVIAKKYLGYKTNDPILSLDDHSPKDINTLFGMLDNGECRTDMFLVVLRNIQNLLKATLWANFFSHVRNKLILKGKSKMQITRTNSVGNMGKQRGRSFSKKESVKKRNLSKSIKKLTRRSSSSPRLTPKNNSGSGYSGNILEYFPQSVADDFLFNEFKTYLQSKLKTENLLFVRAVYLLENERHTNMWEEILGIARAYLGYEGNDVVLAVSHDLLIQEFNEKLDNADIMVDASIFNPIIYDVKNSLRGEWNEFCISQKGSIKKCIKYLKKRKGTPCSYVKLE
eukprot:TRINITY_DN4642_c0_g1_i1.p1 TRINITY_DN4642_c0_g1~~TRINITY_DN4642_c0_g1_i1.p1  ORF type:complete len:524 (-),score=114.60 TRINITY_DN4642_c0_g1_i1:57-1628(-)